MIPAAPIVAPGAGGTLPDRYAERLAEQWISDLDLRCDLVTRRLMRFRDAGPLPGNPITACRWVRDYRKIGGAAIVAGWGTSFSNSRSTIIDKVGRHALDEADDCVRVLRWEFSSAIRGKSFPVRGHGQVAAFDRHSLGHLVKTADVRSADEVLDFLSANWAMISTAAAVAGQVDGSRWLIPARGRESVLLISRPRPASISCNGEIVGVSAHAALDIADVISVAKLPPSTQRLIADVDAAVAEPPAPGEPVPEQIIAAFESLRNQGGDL